MYYSEDLVEEVRARNDIVDVIGSYVRLQKKGANYMGLCPFHNEKSPSFSVSASKQMYHCFGCGVGGNVFTFLMEYENYTFVETLKTLAERAGVKLPELEHSEEEKKAQDLRGRLLEIHKEAAKYYFFQLKKKQGAAALAYLLGRGLSEETLLHFGLGYSNPYSDDLYQYMKQKGYEDTLLTQSGLFRIEEKGAYDKFWNRVMFPIMDANNRVIAFGGRVMGDGTPKYLNSPETKIFDKSRNLYGLNFARQSRKDYFLLCEGYMDVISLHQAGFTNAVASLGTAFTLQQAKLLTRYVKEVILTYDSDTAGVKATLRALSILREAGLTAKILEMKPYKDPDEFIQTLGKAEYQTRIDNAMNSFFFEVEVLEKDYSLADPEQKTKFFHEMAKRLLVFTEELERNNYIEALAGKYKLHFEDLKRLVNRYGADLPLAQSMREAKEQERRERTENKKEKEKFTSHKLLLTWLSSDLTLFGRLKHIIGAEDFAGTSFAEAAKLLFDQYEQEHRVNPARIINHFESKEEQTEVAELFSTQIRLSMDEAQKKKLLEDTVKRVKRTSLDYQYQNAIENNDIAALQAIITKQKELEKLHSSFIAG